MGNSAYDGNFAVQQNELPFLMLPRNNESVERQNCFSLQWNISLALLPTTLCSNMGGDGLGGGGGGSGDGSSTGTSSSSSSSGKGDDNNNSSLQLLCPYAD